MFLLCYKWAAGVNNKMNKWINEENITRNNVITVHKGLVYEVCKYYAAWGYRLGFDYSDLLETGYIGLINAFDRFDSENYTVRFSTYAYPLIRGEVQNLLSGYNAGLKYSLETKRLAWKIYEENMENDTTEKICDYFSSGKQKVNDSLHFLRNEHPESIEVMGISELDEHASISADDDHTLVFVKGFFQELTREEAFMLREIMLGKSQLEISKILGVSQALISKRMNKVKMKYLDYSEAQPKNMNFTDYVNSRRFYVGGGGVCE